MFGLFKKKNTKESIDSSNLFLKIKEVVRETQDAVSVVFEEPESGSISYESGQYLTLITSVNGKKVRRAYSLSSSIACSELPTVTVKRVEGGLMSNHVNDTFQAGNAIEVMAPMGNFILDKVPGQHAFLFAGGSGITPLISITKTLLTQESTSKVTLVYANRDMDSIIFKSKLEDLQSQYKERLNIIHCLEKAPNEWDGYRGYLTQSIIGEVLETYKDDSSEATRYMTCGPEPMMNIVIESLKSFSIASDLIFKESFTPATKTAEKSDSAKTKGDKQVTIHVEGESHTISVPDSKSILEAGLDEGIDMPYSCQSGLCTACRATLTKGEIDMGDADGLTEDEKNQGYVLLCVGHAKSDSVEVKVG